MDSLWVAAAFAIFIWWFSTGLILLLDSLPRTTFRWSQLLSSLLAGGALLGIASTAGQTTLAATYCAFTCALLVWGWHELAFLTGWITGPQRTAISEDVQGWPRFVAAVRAILWHELAIAAGGLLIWALTLDAANQIALWTYLVLWLMRISAKFNLFLGVRNLSEEFLPPHLAYMASFFRRRRMNLLFPVVVTAATVVAVLLVERALADGTGAVHAVGLTLVATLLWLAIVEHWLLVLPLQATALWRWAMQQQDKRSGRDRTAAAEPAAVPVADTPALRLP